MIRRQRTAHQTLAAGKRPTKRRPACPVDHRPCEVLQWFSSATSKDVQPVLDARPCEHCRGGEKTIRQIAGRRFGPQERWVLQWLIMESSSGPFTEVPSIPDTRAGKESLARAVRSLRDAGLIVAVAGSRRTQSGELVRFTRIRPTLIGGIVLEQIADALESDARIRWPKVLATVQRTARLRGLHLVREFVRRARAESFDLRGNRRRGVSDRLLDGLRSPRKPMPGRN